MRKGDIPDMGNESLARAHVSEPTPPNPLVHPFSYASAFVVSKKKSCKVHFVRNCSTDQGHGPHVFLRWGFRFLISCISYTGNVASFPHHHGKQQIVIEHGIFSQKINQHDNLQSHKNDEFLPPPAQLLNKQTTQHNNLEAMSTTAAKQARHDH